MSRLYSYTYMSLDGVIESPEKWTSSFFSAEMGQDLATRLESAAAMVLGRVTYTEFADFWPRQGDDVPFATLNNTIPKIVVSETVQDPQWHKTTVVRGAEVASLKATSQGDLHITGSGMLLRNLLQQGVLDEVRIIMCPVVLGRGRRLFEDGTATELALTEVQQFPRGVLALTYTRSVND
jgi:dihydrofolate reductase